MSFDPLGRQPRPVTGNREPDYGQEGLAKRVADKVARFKTIWIDHLPQLAIIEQLREYRFATLGRRGVPLSGRRLSQYTQAGKSACMWRLKQLLAEERAAEGLPPNKYQIVIITIAPRMTLKQFFQEILKELSDEFVEDTGKKPTRDKEGKLEDKSLAVLEQRIAEWVVRLGVDMIVADEAQRLDRQANDAGDVTNRIQTFIDRGVVPLVLVGNSKSVEFFEKNKDLAARLGTPMKLHPLDPDKPADAKLFLKFCRKFDRALVSSGATTMLSGLDSDDMLEALATVSGGHVGRVARLLEEALPPSVRRGAATIEAFDLSNATRDYAMGNGWVDHDPFSRPA